MTMTKKQRKRRRDAILHKNEPNWKRQIRKNKGFIIFGLVVLALVLLIIFILTRSKPEPNSGYDFDITLEPETNGNAADDIDDELNNLENEEIANNPVKELENIDNQLTKDHGYEHYLLLGLDGEAGGFKGKRSDAIIIVSINKDNGRLILTSLPRDTYVYIEGKGYDKVTHAYAYGQAKLSVETIENNFDIDIKNYFTMNFQGVEDMVDLLGGIPMYLTEAESVNIRDFFGVPGTQPGNNILNGKQALTYCRVRKIDSDFKRTERQYKVLMAIYEKAKQMSPTKYTAMLKTIYDYIYTDAVLADCIGLATTIMDMGLDDVESVMLIDPSAGTGRKINGTYYFVPNDLEASIKSWREYLGINDYTPSNSLKKISDHIKGTR